MCGLKLSLSATVCGVLVLYFGSLGLAQPVNLEGDLPVVPNLEPRPSEGAQPQQKWRKQRTDAERAPVAEFLESLKGNDAAIEVIVGRSKLLTTKKPIASEEGVAVIAVSDPTVVDFDVLPDSRMIRLIGRVVGVTDLMFVTVDGQTYSFAVHVIYDLDLLRAHLKQLFPDADIRLGQIREHLVVEGQARSDAQVEQILNTIDMFLMSSQRPGQTTSSNAGAQLGAGARARRRGDSPDEPSGSEDSPDGDGTGAPPDEEGEPGDPGVASEEGARPTTRTTILRPQIINLLKVPGVHQVLLKVQIAELNRVALRQIGADLFANIGNNAFASFGGGFATPTFGVNGSLTELLFASAAGTLVGVFDSGSFTNIMQALRRNNVATILAEPNLVTLNGHEARFQSGGEFPVPVAQAGAGVGSNTVEFKDFGIQLAFVPYILDGGIIRLHVEPEVSSVAEELSVSLIVNGDPIPGLRTRNAATTVELREGETLAIAGLLSKEYSSNSSRIPFLGDLPYIGTFFGNRQAEVVENELLVAVTPYLVSPMAADQRTPPPGHQVFEPNDLEFYLLNRLEGRTGVPHRSTTHWDNPFQTHTQMQFEQRYIVGPSGLSE